MVAFLFYGHLARLPIDRVTALATHIE